jgi:carboxyl-terminal processing protease
MSAVLLLSGLRVSALVQSPDVQQGRVAKLVAYALPQMHLNRRLLDDQVAVSALDLFLKALDYEHVYFLAGDVARFEVQAAQLDDRLKKGDVTIAFEIYNTFMQRVSNRVAYTEALLDRGFDLAAHETYEWKRKDAAYAADEAEWDALWSKKIKNEYVARVVAERLDEEAAAASNLAAKVEATHTVAASTNAAETVAEAAPAPKKLTPVENILKSYRQFLTVLQDNDNDWLLERYLTSFAQAYDPHTDYMSPHNAEDFEISMKLSLFGIGALLTTDDGAAKVERLIPGGPAERDGRLKPGDKIIAVAQGDGEAVDVRHWPLYKTVRLIRGEKNTKVVLTVLPASDLSGSKETFIDLTRDEVKIEEQAAKGETKDVPQADGSTLKVGIIRLPEFYLDARAQRANNEEARSASRDVRRILLDMVSNGVQGVVLDLRNNGGGYLTEAVEMTGLFLESGPVVQVKDQRRTQVLPDPDPGVAYNGPLVVLVNRLSASASEILAAALQDYGRAIIVGDTKTHGKGSVQSLNDLVSGNPKYGSIKVTTASFYRISGGSTQLKGVTPDIVVPSLLESMDVGEEQLEHALPWSKIDEAFYAPAANLAEYVPTLKMKSEERREKDARQQSYHHLLQRAEERQQAREITLNLDERLQLARSDRELQKLLEKLEPDEPVAPPANEDEKKDDVILDESLSILSDLIHFTVPSEAVTHSVPSTSAESQPGPM